MNKEQYLNAINEIDKLSAGLNGTSADDIQVSGSLDRSKERDPNGIAPNSPGAKLDAGKNRVWLCVSGFSNALQHVANVTTKGAIKYTPNGWMEVDNGVDRYMDAFGRHMLALGTGERVDADTGALHKAQMIWNLLASLELELREEKNGSNT